VAGVGRFGAPRTHFSGRAWSMELGRELDEVFRRFKDAISVIMGNPPTPSPVALGSSLVAVVGVSQIPAAGDHVHNLPTAQPANPTGTAASPGVASTVLRSDCVVPQGIVTAKGDLLTYAAVPAKLAVGADGQTLVADSTQTTGLKWTAGPASDTVNVTTKTANYNATATDAVILGDATGASFTVTLPQASTVPGKRLCVKKLDSTAHTVTIAAHAGDLVEGSATQVLSQPGQAVTIISDATNWYLISFNV
jgi:hypothetical protein